MMKEGNNSKFLGKLEEVLKWKRIMGREKDLKDIERLEGRG